MSYTHTTLTQLKSQLANRLGDAGNVYWTDTELGLYITEALRTWGLATGYWRDSGQFSSAVGQAFYDISPLQNSSLESLLTYTVTDSDLCTLMQYHLLEPPTGTSWTGSEQFTLTDVVNSLQNRRNTLLIETEAVVSSFSQNLPAGASTVDLPDTTMSIRRMAWTGALTGTSWPLYPEDVSNLRNYTSGYMTTNGTPQTYSSSSSKLLRYVIAPPPAEPGNLNILAIQSGTTLTSGGVVLGIPDDMSWIIKWGALADMLGKEGPGQDLGRAYFCERRWKLGIELARVSQTLVNAEIDGVSLSSESISRFDQYAPNWYTTTGTPSLVGSMRNILALSTAPDGVYNVLLDVVRKAIIPSASNPFVQVAREYINPIIDYAEHLASFKCGGMEFRQTYRGADNFFAAALSYNERLSAQSPNISELIRQSTLDDHVLPPTKRSASQPLEQQQQITEQNTKVKQVYGGQP